MDEFITEESLAELIPAFYARVRQDALIGPLFNEAIHDWPEHLGKLTAFWSSVMLTSGRYKGSPMVAHLRHIESIKPAMFQRWLEIWAETTAELMPPEAAAALQAKAARIGESLQLGLSFHAQRVA
ncbi:preprotein translocase subunit TatC [Sphingomonas sp. MAH-20]|uniref:Preprotein translocase subunit TatC n=1 Tax=Sphingomonas horti TaxID=2682842 RepID=A0A6I4IWT7_9SPHN|nr:group III truncated hemoglobin [Sphingomonas sp. CGMCC 1.13658]MVO76544.1 preprotein translocase subunit TatC [Sphingomonas horti]